MNANLLRFILGGKMLETRSVLSPFLLSTYGSVPRFYLLDRSGTVPCSLLALLVAVLLDE